VLRPEHPIAWGYPQVTHVFRGNQPLFTVPERLWGSVVLQYGTKTIAQEEIEADKKADIPTPAPDPSKKKGPDKPLCLSGMVKGEEFLVRRPAVIDASVGKGRVIFYSFNPMHRYQNFHDFGLVTNALLFYNDLPDAPSLEEMRRREAD
jgi:hypothetical protein